MAGAFVKLDPWVWDLLVDPLGKEPLFLAEEGKSFVTAYGRRYPVTHGVIDLRLLNNDTTPDQRKWKLGQREYAKWAAHWAGRDPEPSLEEIANLEVIYSQLQIEGRCLDVGGHQGTLRRFLTPGQDYVICDPFFRCFEGLELQQNLLKAYPVLLQPVNFVCCDAEFLPFRSGSFQTVHMRSVIDHLLSPELALNEAYRVLAADGALVVGLFVQGGRTGRTTWTSVAKKLVREALFAVGVGAKDYHVWHPTFAQLTGLMTSCGFQVEKVCWQKGYNDTVCYVGARKTKGLMRSPD